MKICRRIAGLETNVARARVADAPASSNSCMNYCKGGVRERIEQVATEIDSCDSS